MAYQFNGTNQALRVGDSIISSFPFTMSCHYRPAALDAFRLVMAICPSGANDPYFYLGTRDTLKATGGFVTPNTGIAANSATSLSLSTWAALTVKLESTRVTIYINGVSEGSTTHSTAFPSGANRFAVASLDRLDPLAYASGPIADAAVWDTALTDAEIASLGKGFTPDQIRPQSLQFYAPLVRDLVDVRGGRAITNVNGATVATHPRVIQ